MFGLIKERLLLDLKHCTYTYSESRQLMVFTSQRNGSEYAFSVPRHDERDMWRMAVECSYDLYVNKRDPSSVERMASAIELMKRGKGGAKTPKGTQSRKLGRGGKKHERRSRSKRSTSMHTSAETARKTLEITTTTEKTEDEQPEGAAMPLITPMNHPSKRVTIDGNLGKNTIEPSNMTLTEFQAMKKSQSSQAFFGDREGVAEEAPVLKKGRPEKSNKARFPGLQRKASTSSALFGSVTHKPNAPPGKEFKFNSSAKKKK